VYFPHEEKLHFVYPERLIRLRFTYSNIPEKTIKAYFNSFRQKVDSLNDKPGVCEYYVESSSSLSNLIENEFLPEDSSALRFGETKKGLLYNEETKKILDNLYNIYFTVFDINESNKERVDESVLLKRYKKLILDLDKELFTSNSKITLGYTLKKDEAKEFDFDIAWQGQSSTNLVKPISFDVRKNITLTNKAYKFYGRFLDLEKYALDNHYNFDILLAKPKDKTLFKDYDYAIKLLEKPKQVTLIEEDGLKSYSLKTIKSINEAEHPLTAPK
jgi:hypothetical protein